MEPPPFNFNAASGSGSTSQSVSASSAFGSALPKATFGSSLFGKQSILAQAAKREAEKPIEKNDQGAINLLAGRLTHASKTKPSLFSARGDSSDKVSIIREGLFQSKPKPQHDKKVAFGQLVGRRTRENTPEESRFGNEKQVRPNLAAPLFAGIGKKEQEPKRARKELVEGIDETDHAPTRDLPPSMFGIPLATSTTLKGFGSMPQMQEKPPPAKSLGEKTWKASKPRSARESPAPEARPTTSSGADEAKLVQKLAALRGQVCPGEFEKYMILVERDKILCQLRENNSCLVSRLEKCEEMCTERERYQRIVQKGVSPFECSMENGDVSHEMMVKQYARSAADQDRPLPHDFRTEKIMNQTMGYLLHNILDDFPETADQRAAWYNFLWNRTRALRKEVTQLSMTDSLALNLVEQCTRLHILFAYKLCDLETEHFDAAMNNETLGKCLQTLRHFYEDFEKRGIPCANESEFRSYDIMLHMNDTNVLSQVLSYRSEVRQSEAVRLALQLAGAFRDNNYCRFFRLLKSQATFLQCCVSHKLFASVRSSAIFIITNAYGKAMFPLDKLKNILGFDTSDDLILMLNLYGLRTEHGSDQVSLTKDDLTLNETTPLTSYFWIDSKNSGKLSQVVHGPDMFQFFASRCDVSNSFNHRNEYVHDKVVEAVLDGSNIPVTNQSAAFSFAQSSGSLSMSAAFEQRKKMEMERLKRQEEGKKDQLILKMINGVIDGVIKKLVQDEVLKSKTLRKQMREEEETRRRLVEKERHRLEMERKRREAEAETARRVAETIEKEEIQKEVIRIAAEEMEKEREKRERKVAQELLEKFWNKEVLRAVDRKVRAICDQMVNEKDSIIEHLDTFRDRMAKQWLQQFWDQWRTYVEYKKEWRRKKVEMVVRSAPVWESEEVAYKLAMRYATSSEVTIPGISSILDRPKNSIQMLFFKKNRTDRILRWALRRWRETVRRKTLLKRKAEEQQKRENEFFGRFKHAEPSERIETRFEFDKPEDWMKTKRRRSDDTVTVKRPLKESQSFSMLNTSMSVARRQLEDWEPAPEISSELKDKLKRKRDSFEKSSEEHFLKKKRDEEKIRSEAKANTQHFEKTSEEAESLIDATLQYTADLDRLIAEMEARRV